MKRHYLQATCSVCTQKYAESQGWRCEIIDANEPTKCEKRTTKTPTTFFVTVCMNHKTTNLS